GLLPRLSPTRFSQVPHTFPHWHHSCCVILFCCLAFGLNNFRVNRSVTPFDKCYPRFGTLWKRSIVHTIPKRVFFLDGPDFLPSCNFPRWKALNSHRGSE